MPIYVISKPRDEHAQYEKAVDLALKARYKVYKESRDKGDEPVVADQHEAATFTIMYAADKMRESLGVD